MKIVIEQYVPPTKISKNKFFLPAMPWKWTLYNGLKVVGFGYTHSEEDANKMANQAINQYSPFRA